MVAGAGADDRDAAGPMGGQVTGVAAAKRW